MYNLSNYSHKYLDTSGILWQFKRDVTLAGNADEIINNSSNLIGNTLANGTNRKVTNAKNNCSD